MKKLFEKYETLSCILLIILYLLINSYCLNNFGTLDYRTTLINTLLSIFLITLTIILKRTKYYGFNKVTNIKQYLYFIPLLLIISVNLLSGIKINNSPKEITFYILNMINIGFIEELIFRGYLFKMIAKDNIKTALIVTSLTFGIGHIINLLFGADPLSTIFQIISAISIGYLFATIFYKSNSIIPCIITHSLINSLSIFNNSNNIFIESIILIIIPLLYSIYINKKIKN